MSAKPFFPCPTIQKTKQVYVAWVNSDLTEGRGFNRVLCVTQLEETARRLGKGKNVQGSDANVVQDAALLVFGDWYIQGDILEPSAADEELWKANQEKAKAQKIFDKAVERAKMLGLSDDDIKILQGAAK